MSLGKQIAAVSSIKSNFNKIPISILTTSNLDTLLSSHCLNLTSFNQLLSHTITTGLFKHTYAASRILKHSTSSPFIHIHHSYKIFNSIQYSNGFICNTMLRAFVETKSVKDSFFLYNSLLRNDSLWIDNYTYPTLIQGCTVSLSLFEGRELHDHVVKMGYDNDVYVVNNLITMYSVCGDMGDARKVFDESLVLLDSVSWNTMLGGYVATGDVEEAKSIFGRMPKKNAVGSSSLIALLGKSGRVSEAHSLFNGLEEKDLLSWTALISSYEQNEMFEGALYLFFSMYGSGMRIDEVTAVTVLSACAKASSLRFGEVVHGLVVRIGFESYVNLQNALIHMYSLCGEVLAAQRLFRTGSFLDRISWNSMISGYIKCGLIEKARELFDNMPDKDAVTWSSVISGYAQLDNFTETLSLFSDMQREGVRPDESTLVSVISACTQLGAFDQGKWVYAYIRKNKLRVNPILGTTLIDMYMKCGSVEEALTVFHGLEEKGVSSWNALILGFAMNGQVETALEMFEEMKRSGMVPNEITFVAVLGACRHKGLVDEGWQYFESIVNRYHIQPNVRHYGCLVDLLGRRGFLREAEQVIDIMPMAPDVATWGALLGACRKHGDKEMGERIGRKLIELQPDHDGYRVLLSNIYASEGDWADALKVRELMSQHGLVKAPGCSMIEANGAVHEFLAGDKSHPNIKEIKEMLGQVVQRSKRLSYDNEDLLDIDEQEK